MDYNDFLHSKVQVAPVSGFEVQPEDITIQPILDILEQEAI